MKDIPTLRGFIHRDSKGDLIYVWCPRCNQFHQHGWVDGNPRMKHHREAHCWDISSKGRPPHLVKETGYYIKPFTKADLKKLGAILPENQRDAVPQQNGVNKPPPKTR